MVKAFGILKTVSAHPESDLAYPELVAETDLFPHPLS